jgi:hypothetical protein
MEVTFGMEKKNLSIRMNKRKNWMNGFEEQEEKARLGFGRFDVSGRLRD